MDVHFRPTRLVQRRRRYVPRGDLRQQKRPNRRTSPNEDVLARSPRVARRARQLLGLGDRELGRVLSAPLDVAALDALAVERFEGRQEVVESRERDVPEVMRAVCDVARHAGRRR